MNARLLLIEFDVLTAWNEMQHLLNEGFAVSHARSLAQALEPFLERPERYDLIIVDPRKLLIELGVYEIGGGIRPCVSGEIKAILDPVKSPIAIRDSEGRLVYSNRSYGALRAEPCHSGLGAATSEARTRVGAWMREGARDRGALGRTIEPEEFFDEAAGEWRGFLTTRVPLCGKDRVPFCVMSISADLADGGPEERLMRELGSSPTALLDEGWDEPVLADLPGWPTLEFAAV